LTLCSSGLLLYSAEILSKFAVNNMCVDDGDAYTTRVRVRNGVRYSEEYVVPRYGMSWRRRHGFGGSYYPSRYYSRPPTSRDLGGVLVQSNRHSTDTRHARHNNYPPCYSHYGNTSKHPRGVVPAGYAGYGYGYGYDQAGYPRGLVTGGYAGYSSGYGRYHTCARVATPRHSAMVSLHSFLLSPVSLPSCLPVTHRTPLFLLARVAYL
jgi:hypothetical protein